MSYILEALKKSDKKRKQGKVPDLDTVQTVPPPERENPVRWPYFLIGALVLNGLVFGIYFTTIAPEETGGIVQRNPGPSQSTTLMEKAETVSPQETGGSLPTYELKKMAMPVVKSVDRPGTNRPLPSPLKPEPAGGMSEENQGQTAAVVETEPGADSPQDPEAAVQQQADSFPETPLAEPLETDFFEQDPGPEVTAELPPEPVRERETSTLEKSAPEVVGINQLPYSVRKDLPEFRISVHGYAESPESRIVSINGRVLREGDLLSSKLRLDEIIEDGVILSYQGKKFKVGIF